MGHEIIVDGYNVIKSNDMYRFAEQKSLEHARMLLLKHLHMRFHDTYANVIVVFDGDGEVEHVRHENRIRVIFSRREESADSVIARLAAEARQRGYSVEMYSNDVEVQEKVTEQGGSAYTSKKLNAQLNAPSSDVAHRARHRILVRREYGFDPWHKAEDEDEPDQRRVPGKKKKRSSRRR